MTDRAHMPADRRSANLLCYEELIGGARADYEWPVFDENTASSLCYTSGTTGNPKGVLYSHRSTVLHTLRGLRRRRARRCPSRESMLLVVPMFHVNAWGMPYAGADVRRQAGAAGPGARRQERLRADARREGDARARRADGVADAVQARRHAEARPEGRARARRVS